MVPAGASFQLTICGLWNVECAMACVPTGGQGGFLLFSFVSELWLWGAWVRTDKGTLLLQEVVL